MQHKRSRSRAREHEHEHRSYSKYDKKFAAQGGAKQPQMAFKEEKLEQPGQSLPAPANMYAAAGNMPMADSNSSNLLNMAYVMNQQLQSSSVFEPYHNVAPLPLAGPPNPPQFMVAEPEPKKEKELLFGASLGASNESNLEGSYSHGKYLKTS